MMAVRYSEYKRVLSAGERSFIRDKWLKTRMDTLDLAECCNVPEHVVYSYIIYLKREPKP